jgi:hypothetical protein
MSDARQIFPAETARLGEDSTDGSVAPAAAGEGIPARSPRREREGEQQVVGGEGRGRQRRRAAARPPASSRRGSPAPRDRSINQSTIQAKPEPPPPLRLQRVGLGKRRGAPALRWWWSPCSGIWGTRPTHSPTPIWAGGIFDTAPVHPVLNLFALNFLYHFIHHQFLSFRPPPSFSKKTK